MVKYIKGKDGKFAGSIGEGKNNIPTASPINLAPNTPDSHDTEDMEAIYEKFMKSKDANMIISTWDTVDSFGVPRAGIDTKNFSGEAEQLEDDSWEGYIYSFGADYEHDEGGTKNGFQGEIFNTKEEAIDWSSKQAIMKQKLLDNFEKEYSTNGKNLTDAAEIEVDRDSEYYIEVWNVKSENYDVSVQVKHSMGAIVYSVDRSKNGEVDMSLEFTDPDKAKAFSWWISAN